MTAFNFFFVVINLLALVSLSCVLGGLPVMLRDTRPVVESQKNLVDVKSSSGAPNVIRPGDEVKLVRPPEHLPAQNSYFGQQSFYQPVGILKPTESPRNPPAPSSFSAGPPGFPTRKVKPVESGKVPPAYTPLSDAPKSSPVSQAKLVRYKKKPQALPDAQTEFLGRKVKPDVSPQYLRKNVPQGLATEPESRPLPTELRTWGRVQSDVQTQNMKLATGLRNEALKHGREVERKMREAISVSDANVAKQIENEINEHLKLRDELDNQAAKLIFEENNRTRSPTSRMVNLHGLYVREAEFYAKNSIRNAKQKGLVQLQFIVGKGNHSRKNIPQVKLAIEALLRQEGLTHQVHPMNEGILVVALDSPPRSGDVSKHVNALGRIS
ncbi:hypothetical protein PGT21_027370 [Puccinia graminis f. sp. tritici]|uniref:Smr domain-containing protein n=1 Tax=Puccinia graminis f. sp. tritici TaxID=56615 RepID=A0A5B0QVN8_PUCGR|nr:hypothetical protein PGT21_027370 [Puccinia graminis f. sp. tritici]KAA1116985.1 hypothetical protein PGTUg99_033186 [Puccinia graminis f. sp. tritici]